MSAKSVAAPFWLVAATALCCVGAISACGSSDTNPGFQGGDNSSSGSNGSSGNNSSGNGSSGNGSGANGSGGNGSGTGSGGNGSGGNGSGTSNSSGTGSGAGSSGAAGSSSNSSSGGGSSGGLSSSSSSSGSGSGSSSGSASGSSSSGAASACAATAPGAIMLQQGGYFSAPPISIGMGGYTFSFSDGLPMGSTACVSTTSFCGMGTAGIANPPTYSIYGGGFGLSLNQAMATGVAMPPVMAFPATGTGIAYTLSNLPTGARLIIDNGGKDYCAILTLPSATVPWSSFNTTCYTPAMGVALTGPPTATQIKFEVPSGTAAQAFNFCVTSLKFM